MHHLTSEIALSSAREPTSSRYDQRTTIDPEYLLERLVAPDYHPPLLPVIAVELVSLTHKPGVDLRDIAAVLKRDPLLTADTLRLANTAALKGLSNLPSIEETLVRLGIRRATHFFFRAALESKVLRCGGAEAIFERLRKHSVATAELCSLVADEAGITDSSAYLCGLLHDVGIAGCMLAIGCAPQRNADQAFARYLPSILAVQAQFAQHILKAWNLPSELGRILQEHHDFGQLSAPHPLAAVTYVAEYLATSLRCGFGGEMNGEHVASALRILGIADRKWAAIEDGAAAVVAQIVEPQPPQH